MTPTNPAVSRASLSESIEDYLKAIYELTRASGRASTSQIAERMGVTPASASGMVQKLAATTPPLVKYEKHHGVLLTDEGEKIALEIIRYHRLLELFLQEALGFPWDQVHEEADRLEHVISPDFAERIARILGEPQRDPHGHPIPSRELTLPHETDLSLRELRPGQRALIRRVEDEDPGLLRHLESMGLKPSVPLEVLAYSAYDGNLELRIGGRVIVLGPAITSKIYVEVTNVAPVDLIEADPF